MVVKTRLTRSRNLSWCIAVFLVNWSSLLIYSWIMFNVSLRIWSHLLEKSLMENFIFCAVSIIGMFMYKELTSNDTITSSSLIGIFLIWLESMVEFFALLFSSLTSAFRMLAMYLLRLYNGEPLYGTIGRIEAPCFSIFCQPKNVGAGESLGFR